MSLGSVDGFQRNIGDRPVDCSGAWPVPFQGAGPLDHFRHSGRAFRRKAGIFPKALTAIRGPRRCGRPAAYGSESASAAVLKAASSRRSMLSERELTHAMLEGLLLRRLDFARFVEIDRRGAPMRPKVRRCRFRPCACVTTSSGTQPCHCSISIAERISRRS